MHPIKAGMLFIAAYLTLGSSGALYIRITNILFTWDIRCSVLKTQLEGHAQYAMLWMPLERCNSWTVALLLLTRLSIYFLIISRWCTRPVCEGQTVESLMLLTDVDALNGKIHYFKEGLRFLWDSPKGKAFDTYIKASEEQLFVVYYEGIIGMVAWGLECSKFIT